MLSNFSSIPIQFDYLKGVRYHFLMILPPKNNDQVELRNLTNYVTLDLTMSKSESHKNPTGVTPIAFDLFGNTVEPLLCPNYV